jgi:hypothetical protein
MTPAIHCPDCGATTRRVLDDDGCEYAVCADDDCPRVYVSLLSFPVPMGVAAFRDALAKGKR